MPNLSNPLHHTGYSATPPCNGRFPSDAALKDWTPTDAGTALRKWKKKLRTSFGVSEIGAGRQPIARRAPEAADPSKVPLPQTPKKRVNEGSDTGVFTATAEASPYVQDSHMVTPRSASRSERLAEETESLRPTPNTAMDHIPEAIRHDREPGFMSDFFRAFNKVLGQRQRATMSYRLQANGSAERMVQTTTRAIKMYVQDLDQRDWDEYAERITFAINTAHDRIRGETPFYMVHGWDPRSTLEAVIPVGSTRRHDRDPRRWRYRTQRYYQQVREQVNQRLREAISDRADLHNQEIRPHQIEVGSRVWLYLDRVKEGYAKKLAHLWHGPFRIVEKVGEHAVKLEIAGSGYHVFPIVHVTKLKLVKEYPDRPLMRLNVASQDHLDFDEDLLPGDSWIQDRDPDEYEVEKITDMRSGRRTRYGRIYRKFLVHWRGYDDPTWVDEADLNCGALLHEFLRDRANHNRFGVSQSHEES
ncbi:Reverse transcriptase [Phytophthora palmivora]|uniref:Reverse transcriptase n=1 Tax=Phytophthora palmivora TaxID=4796 RepID=A0A2P4XT27_9STRA|nr:Reverse transcriptase [Phytophthora palmivora]